MAIWSAERKELVKIYESFKGQLPELEKELERLIRANDEKMILLYLRRCLEHSLHFAHASPPHC